VLPNSGLLYYENGGYLFGMPLVNLLDNLFGIMVQIKLFIRNTRYHQTMHHPMVKKIVFISLLGFFLAVMVVSLHHHDNSFWSPTCSICKLKASINGAFNKIKVDSAPAVASLHLLFISIFLCLSRILHENKTIFINSQIAVTYPNKAPPFSF
jgi:hypothetical protein